MIALPADFALVNNSLTLAAHIPTSISINSEPELEKNAVLDSPATALANNVFPDQG